MASPAFEHLSRRLCRVCRIQSSSSSGSRRSYASTSASSSSSTSSLEVSNLVSSLRFEVGQSRPSSSRIWERLTTLYDISPSSIPSDLLFRSIPSLLNYSRQSRKTSRFRHAHLQIIAVQEEAESLYTRYRFLVNALQQQEGEVLPGDIALDWLKGLESLGYAPAAWRIWRDRLDIAQTEEGVVDKSLAHSVLIASLKWLGLCKANSEANAEQIALNEKVVEIMQECNAIFSYLRETNQTDSISRSLQIRLIKETRSPSETRKAISEAFDFNFSHPQESGSLPFSGQSRSTSAKTTMDRHTLNTVLTMYAEQKELSKMISVYEAAAYPMKATKVPLQTADQYSFFSSSRQLPESAESEGHVQEPPYSTTTTTSIVTSSSSIPLRSHTPAVTTAINTHTFELLIETANSLGCYAVAQHYLQEMFNVWKQERSRLRSAFAELEIWTEPASTELEEDTPVQSQEELPSFATFGATEASHSGISIHSIFSIYGTLRYRKDENQRNTPYLTSLLKESKEILGMMQEDVGYWAEMFDKKRRLQRATERRQEAQAKLTVPEETEPYASISTSSTGRKDTFSTKTHLILLKRTEIELDELVRRIETKQSELALDRFLTPLIYELSGRRYYSTIPRIRTAISRAERWLLEDEALDMDRLKLINSTRAFSEDQKRKRMNNAHLRMQNRRRRVRIAVGKAKAALGPMIEDATRARALRLEEKEAESKAARQVERIETENSAGMGYEDPDKDRENVIQAAPSVAFHF